MADPGIRALIEKFLNTQRKTALITMLKAYKPTIPQALVQQQLGYKNKPECMKDIIGMGVRTKNGDINVATSNVV